MWNDILLQALPYTNVDPIQARFMTSQECRQRAADCVANAAMSNDSLVASEFLRLAAHWRAMAVREIFLGHVAEPTALRIGDA